jgi:hypothetical protein
MFIIIPHLSPAFNGFYENSNDFVTIQPDGCRYVSATHNRRMYIRKHPLRLNNRNDQHHLTLVSLCLAEPGYRAGNRVGREQRDRPKP